MSLSVGYPVDVSDERDRGIPIEVPPDWLKAVDVALVERGWTRSRLADESGTSKQSVSRLFHGKASDVVVARVSKTLGLHNPAATSLDADLQTWTALGARLRAGDAETFAALVLALKRLVERDEALEDVRHLLSRRR